MYWGYKRPLTFGAWLFFAVTLVTGAIWLGVGLANWMGCGYCYDGFKSKKPTLSLVNVNTTAIDKGCVYGALAFQVSIRCV